MATVVPQNESVCSQSRSIYVCMYVCICQKLSAHWFRHVLRSSAHDDAFRRDSPPPFTTKLRPWKSIPTTATFEKSGFLFEPP